MDKEDKAEAARKAFDLLRPDKDQAAVDNKAFAALSNGTLSGDLAISLWTEKRHYYLLEAKLRSAVK